MSIVEKSDLAFFQRLLSAPGPSSFESKPAAIWREQAGSYGAVIGTDAYGNSFATFKAGVKPRVMLAGHIDEIGLIVNYISDGGFLYFKGIGGWDSQQLIGQRVRVLGYQGELLGVIGKKPIHLMAEKDRGKISHIEDMWIDIGAKGGEEAKEHVRVGDVAVIEQPLVELLNGRLVSKAIDNRIGAYIVLEAARRAARKATAEIVAVATVQEEIGGIGAYVASYGLEPDVALAVDVTHATDIPELEKKAHGDVPLGSGPSFTIGSYVHRGVLERLITTAEKAKIPYTLETSPRGTGTDADAIAKNRRGAPTAVVSIPNRYMHSPSEMIDPEDLESVIKLIIAFVESLEPGTVFVQP